MIMYSVYVHTFPDGKRYVGATSTDVEYRWGSNGCNYKNPEMRDAIKKAGWENIKHEVIAVGLTEEEASIMERSLIKKYNSADERYGYNISLGGVSSKTMSDRTKQKLRKANLGKVMSKEAREKISNYQRGIKRSEETIQHMREAQKLNYLNGNKAFHSPEARAKTAIKLKGRKACAYAIEKASEAKFHPVQNLITKEIYPSIKAASEATGYHTSTIIRHCNNHCRRNVWIYAGEKGTKI